MQWADGPELDLVHLRLLQKVQDALFIFLAGHFY